MTPKTLQLKSRSVQSISGSRYPQTKGTGSVPFQSAVVQPSCFGSFCRWLGSFFSSNDERQEEAEELSMWEKRKAVIASRNLGLRSNVGHELRERGGNALALNYGLDDEAHWRESLSNFCKVVSRGAYGSSNTRLFYLSNVHGSGWGENTLGRSFNTGQWVVSKQAGIYGMPGEDASIFRSVMDWIDGFVRQDYPVRARQLSRRELDDLV